MFALLSQFDEASTTGYEKEEDINDLLSTIAEINKLLGCSPNPSGSKFTFSMDTDAGEVDTETLRMKLQTLSPYYISPDTMKYITDLLISPDDVQEELMRSSDLFAKIDKSVGEIKRLSGLAV